MRLTRPVVLLALAVLLSPPAEASRTSVWESNPPAAVDLTKGGPASALSSLAPADDVDHVAAELPAFDLGDVVLVESTLEHEDRFSLGPLTLVDLNLLRGPPSSYPETRVGGFELLPPFRVGASPSLSLWSRQACSAFSCELVSDSPEDPWGLCLGITDGPCSALADTIKGGFEKAKGAVRRGLGTGAASVAVDAVVSTGLDVVDTFLVDPLRTGEATGTAIGNDAGALGLTLAIVQDAGRGAALAAGAGAAVKAAARSAQAARGVFSVGDDAARAFSAALSEGAAEVSGAATHLSGGSRFARYGGEAQREALAKLTGEATSLSEAKGLVQGFREMRKLGFSLEDASLAYRGRQGVDAVFSQGGRFAVLEAKAGGSLSRLETYSGLRQGTDAYNISRLQRYLRFGDGANDALARTLLSEAAQGRLESFASFGRARSIFELPSGWPIMPAIRR